MNFDHFESSPLFQKLCDLVQREIDRCRAAEARHQPDFQTELQRVRDRIQGLRESLKNPNLNSNVRLVLEEDLATELDAEADLVNSIRADEQRLQDARQIVDPQEVMERLHRLDDVLHSGNPTEINVELAHFVDRIEVSPGRRVRLRMCPFGMTPKVLALMTHSGGEAGRKGTRAPINPAVAGGTPRRRSIRSVDDRDTAHAMADPHRFSNLPEDWFWVEEFEEPERRTWPETHAEEVFAMRFDADGRPRMTIAALEKHFGRSKPTIQAALKIARERRQQKASADDAA